MHVWCTCSVLNTKNFTRMNFPHFANTNVLKQKIAKALGKHVPLASGIWVPRQKSTQAHGCPCIQVPRQSDLRVQIVWVCRCPRIQTCVFRLACKTHPGPAKSTNCKYIAQAHAKKSPRRTRADAFKCILKALNRVREDTKSRMNME